MNTRKMIGMMVVCAVLASCSTAIAQGGPPGGRGSGQDRSGPPPVPDAEQIKAMVEELDQALDLSDEQEEKVSDLYFAHFEEVEKAMSEKKDRSKMESLRSDFEKDVKALLDDEQKKDFDKYLQSHRPDFRRQGQRK